MVSTDLPDGEALRVSGNWQGPGEPDHGWSGNGGTQPRRAEADRSDRWSPRRCVRGSAEPGEAALVHACVSALTRSGVRGSVGTLWGVRLLVDVT